MPDSLEIQKEQAIKSLIDLRSKVLSLQMNSKGQEASKSQLYDYDEIVSLLDIYFISYSIYRQSLRSKLNSLPVHPTTSKWLSNMYDEIIIIINDCIEEIRANFEFSINPEINSLKITVSRPYLFNIKDESLKQESLKASISDLHKRLTEVTNEKLKAESDSAPLEAALHSSQGKVGSLENRITELTEERSNSESIIKALHAENALVLTELNHFKEQAQRTEVARNSTNFHNQAEPNRKTAKLWGASAVAAIVCFLAIIYFVLSKSGELFDIAKDVTEHSKPVEAALTHQIILIEIAKRIGARLLMVSIIIYFITFLVKNYNAQMHNYIINSHKANALRSTVDLIGTSKQDDGNDKIIIQATQAIFTPQKSGYQGAESEPTSPNLITNVIDAVSSNKKS